MLLVAPLLIPLLLLASACKSDGPRELTKKEKVDYYRGSALSYWDLEDLDRCQDQIAKGLAVDPKDKGLNLLLGYVLQRRGRTEDILRAERVFRDNLYHEDPRINMGLALSLERKGVLLDEAARAIRSGERVTEASDPEKRAGELSREAREAWTEALKHFDITLEKKVEDYDALNGKTRMLALLGREAESVEVARVLLTLVVATADHYRDQLLSAELSERDERNFRDALVRELDFERKVRLHNATVLRRLGRNSEAAVDLERVLQISPNMAEAHSRLSQVLYDMGDYDRARYAIERYITLSTSPVDHPDIQKALDLRNRCETALVERERREPDG
jgi:Tfp pilus assembly protein PilF